MRFRRFFLKSMVLTFGFLILWTMTAPAQGLDPLVIGDFTGDSRLSINDAVKLMIQMRETPSDASLDFNGDGNINVADVIALVLYINSDPSPGPSGNNSVSINEASGAPGATVTLSVLASSDEDIVGALFQVVFDPSMLQITDATLGEATTALTMMGVDIDGANTSGRLKAAIMDLSASYLVTAGNDLELMSITFTIDGNAPTGVIPVQLENVSLSNTSAADIGLTTTNGSVTVTEGGPEPVTGDPADFTADGRLSINDAVKLMIQMRETPSDASLDFNGDGNINVTDVIALVLYINNDPSPGPSGNNSVSLNNASGAPGETVTISVLVSSDEDIVGALFHVVFDPSVLQIAEATLREAATGLSTMGVDIDDANTSGRLKTGIMDLSASYLVTAGNDLEIMRITFTIDGNAPAGVIPVQLENVSLSNTSAADIGLTTTNGSVTVTEGGPEPVTGDPADFTADGRLSINDAVKLMIQMRETPSDPSLDFSGDGSVNIADVIALVLFINNDPSPGPSGDNSVSLNNASGAPGATVTLSVLASSDEDIVGALFQVVFDPSVLQITEATLGEAATALSPMGVDIYDANTSGRLKAAIMDLSASYLVTAGNDLELMRITFTIDGNAPAGVIPVQLENVSLSNTSAADIGLTTVDGSVTVSGEGPFQPSAKTCDFSGDGKILINDVIVFLLRARDNPDDPAVDWNGDGKYAINDAIILLLDIMNGTCPNESVSLSSAGNLPEVTGMQGLSREDMVYIEQMMAKMDLTSEQAAAFRLALYGETGKAELPKTFSLSQNTPNPFNPATTISYNIIEGTSVRVTLKVFDLRGRLVRTLVDQVHEAATYRIFWDGRDESGDRVASGVYFYRMQAGKFIQARKMVLLK